MIGFLFGWMMEHLLLSGVIALLGGIGIGAGVRAVRRHQKKRDKARSAEIARSRKANAAARAAKPKTARQILREQRAQQPLGVMVRKRAAGDERLPRKAVKSVVNRIRVARANAKGAKATTPEKPRILELAAEKIVTAGPKVGKTPTRTEAYPEGGFKHVCNATNRDGSGCQDWAKKNADGTSTGACWRPSHQRQVRESGWSPAA